MGEKLKATVDTVNTEERQQTFLLTLSDALRPLENPVDIEEAATKIALDFMEANRCHYSSIEGDNVIILQDASRGDLPSVSGVHAIRSFALYKAALKEGLPFVVDEVHTNDKIDEDLKTLCLQSGYGSFINVPVIKNEKLVGLLSLVQSKPRKWTDTEVQLTVETAERIWAAVERAKAEEALRKSEEKYRTLFNSIDQGFTLCELICNKEGKAIDLSILEVNTTYEKQTGVTKEMVIGKPLLQVFPSLNKQMETYAAVVDDQRPVEFEHYFEDTARWFAIKAYPIEKEKFVVLFSDITERKQAEEKLKENDTIFKSIPDAIISSDVTGKVTSWNECAEALYGFSKEEMIGQVMPDMVPTQYINKEQQNWREIFAEKGHWKGEVIQTCKGGKKIYVSAAAHVIHNTHGEITGYVAVNRDITLQKEADIKIKESENRFHTMADASPILIWTIDANGLSSYYNKTFLEFIGVSKDEDIADWKKIVHPDDIQSTFDTIDTAIAARRSYSLECRLLRADGQWRWVLAQGNPSIGANNEFLGFVGSSIDITERKKAEEQLKESEKQQAFLLKFSDNLRAEPTVDAVANHALHMLSEYLKLDRCYIGVYQLVEDRGVFPYQVGNERVAPMPASVRLSDFPYALRVAFDGTLVIDDVTKAEGLADTDRQNLSALGLCAFVAATLRHGENNPLWSMVAVSASPRGWTFSDVKLIEEVTERTWAAVERAQAEEALRSSEEKFRTLFTSIDQGFLLGEIIRNKEGKGIDYYVHQVNTTYEKQTGISVEMVLGKTLLEAFPTVDTWWIDTYAAVVDNQCPVRFERFFEFTNRWFEIKASPGEQDRFTILFTDISERKQAENKIKDSEQEIRKIKEQLELSIRAGKIGIWHWDVKNDLLHWSKEQRAIYGLEPSAELIDVAQYKALVIPEDWERLNKELQSAPIAEEQEYDFRIIRKDDGEIRWIKSRARNIVDEQGELQFISGVNIDVTEQVLALNKLKKSEEKFKRLVQQAPVAICVLRGQDYVIETMNEGMCAFWGRTLTQALNKPVFDVLPEMRNQGIKELLDTVYFTGERCVMQELSVDIMRNGKLENAFVKFVYEPLHEADGSISGVMALAHEITEQVLARKKAEESEKKFEAAILAVEGNIWTNNARGEMIGEQLGWAKLTGQRFEEYQGYGWAKAIHPDDAQPTLSAWNDAVNNKRTFEFEHRVKTKQAGWRLFSVKAVPAFDETGTVQQWVGVHTDITKQKLAEEKLAYRTALLEAHNEASIDGILLVDTKGKILSFNRRFIEIWSMPQQIVDAKDDEEALSFAMTQLVNPLQFIDKVNYLYVHPTETCHDELEFFDGRIVERNGYPVLGEDGIFYAWSWTFRDITEKKNYEKTIIESEERFRTLAETLPQLVWITNEKGAYEYASNQWIEYSGLDPYAEDTWEKLVHLDDLENLMQAKESSLQSGKTYHAEARLKNKGGGYRWHLVQGEPIKNEKGRIIKWIGAFTDIENLKEEQKRKDDFLTMASHELKTPVTTIKAYGQIIERILEEKGDVQTLGMINKMSKQVSRLNTLIEDLLNVTKMHKGGLQHTKSVFNFNEPVKEAIDDMQKTTVTHQIMDSLDADVEISADKDKLSQVLNNLISNAIKYSPRADKIIVSTRAVEGGVRLSVQDFGIGISTEEQKHVFEQFYRVTGENQSTFQGMGIGLYICAEIIKREGGKIWVESAVGKGSVFYVELPVDIKK